MTEENKLRTAEDIEQAQRDLQKYYNSIQNTLYNLREHSASRASLQDSYNSLNTEVVNLRRQLSAAESDRDDALYKLRQVEENQDILVKRNEELEDNNTSLVESLREAEEELEQIKQQKREGQEQLEQLQGLLAQQAGKKRAAQSPDITDYGIKRQRQDTDGFVRPRVDSVAPPAPAPFEEQSRRDWTPIPYNHSASPTQTPDGNTCHDGIHETPIDDYSERRDYSDDQIFSREDFPGGSNDDFGNISVRGAASEILDAKSDEPPVRGRLRCQPCRKANKTCNGQEPCERCDEDNIPCKRILCPRYESDGVCNIRKCGMVHHEPYNLVVTARQENNSSAPQRLITCKACYKHNLECDGGDPCSRCCERKTECARVRCKQYLQTGTCNFPGCKMVHDEPYQNIYPRNGELNRDSSADNKPPTRLISCYSCYVARVPCDGREPCNYCAQNNKQCNRGSCNFFRSYGECTVPNCRYVHDEPYKNIDVGKRNDNAEPDWPPSRTLLCEYCSKHQLDCDGGKPKCDNCRANGTQCIRRQCNWFAEQGKCRRESCPYVHDEEGYDVRTRGLRNGKEGWSSVRWSSH